jgi:NAD(P)-dependent dehydrogenase (short-subunit alcohol dehydrogenase family)
VGKIVMTGGTGGFGRIAAQRLLNNGHRLVIGARGAGAPTGAEVRRLDLASLASARSFADGIDGPVDAVVLNAGTQFSNVSARTIDGFEQTFAVNHLAHYLIARLLLPKIADRGRLILTTSGTHDPAEKTGIPAPHHADARRLSSGEFGDDGARIAGLRAYSSSKLCNLMTARSLASSPEAMARNLAVHAYDPGFIPATGLGRQAPWFVSKVIFPILTALKPLGGMNTIEEGGAGLSGLADGSIASDRVYMSLRKGKPTWPDPSDLARDDAMCLELWSDSAEMVGLPA